MRALIADDEPFYLEWLVEYLEAKGLEVDIAESIEEAIQKLTEFQYRIMTIDLSIPLSVAFEGEVRAVEPLYVEYPGLFLAHYARNNGYRTRQVIVYSVHVTDSIRDYVARLYATFIPKGSPHALKEEVDSVLSFTPGS